MPSNDEHVRFLRQEIAKYWQDYGVEQPMAELHKTPQLATEPPHAVSCTDNLSSILDNTRNCTRCGLSAHRKNIVFGTGDSHANLMFVGEGPGADEDEQGLPFVGRAGQLLTKIIEAMGHTRQTVYIANIVKCRPPNNRVPLPEEISQCAEFLKAQITVISPKLIVALGNTAASTLTGLAKSMNLLRGKIHHLQWNNSITVVPTYHPAYLLRNPAAKRLVWEDMKVAMNTLEKLT